MTRSGAAYYYSHDGLGSVRTLTDSAGAAVNRYDYTAWGEIFALGTSAVIPQRYSFTGRERNPAGPLMYYRYRQYDARSDRFEQRDHILLFGAGANLYAAFGNQPTGYVDRYGLMRVRIDISEKKYDRLRDYVEDVFFDVVSDVQRRGETISECDARIAAALSQGYTYCSWDFHCRCRRKWFTDCVYPRYTLTLTCRVSARSLLSGYGAYKPLQEILQHEYNEHVNPMKAAIHREAERLAPNESHVYHVSERELCEALECKSNDRVFRKNMAEAWNAHAGR